MSPQPAAAPKTDPEQAPEPTLTEELYERISKVPEGDRTMPEGQFMRAVLLERRRSENQKEIDANRRFLRLMEQNEALDDDIADWLEGFYPMKEKDSQRSKEEVEATRKEKESARKTK